MNIQIFQGLLHSNSFNRLKVRVHILIQLQLAIPLRVCNKNEGGSYKLELSYSPLHSNQLQFSSHLANPIEDTSPHVLVFVFSISLVIIGFDNTMGEKKKKKETIDKISRSCIPCSPLHCYIDTLLRNRHPSSRISYADPYLKPISLFLALQIQQIPTGASHRVPRLRLRAICRRAAPRCSNSRGKRTMNHSKAARSNLTIVPVVPRTHLDPMIFTLILFLSPCLPR